jgi:ribosome-binding factor A
MSENRRERRIGSLIKEELGRMLIEDFQGEQSGLVTVTRVEMSADLMTARVLLSVFGAPDARAVLDDLQKRQGRFRKALASRINLRYNPELIFDLDPTPEYEERLDRLMESTKKHGS